MLFFCLDVVIGTLPNLLHDVGGTLEYVSTTRILIRDFTYDGEGPGKDSIELDTADIFVCVEKRIFFEILTCLCPDAFLYYFPHGVPVEQRTIANPQGIIIPVPG